MIAPHAIQRHPSNAQPRLRVLHSGCRRACWAMMMRQARRSSAIQHYTVRCGFLSQRSYVAPSRQRRSSSKRPRKELTYCPIYGFKSFLICAKELTPALFCSSVILNPHAYISYSENMHTINCGCHFSARRLHCCLIPSKILSASCWGNWSGRSPLTRSMTPGVLAMISSIIASVCCLLRPVISPCLIQWRRCIRYIW